MNTTPSAPNPPAPHPWRTALLWLAGISAACVIALAVTVINAITLTRDAAALRNELTAALGTHPATRVQVTAGPMLLGTARLVTSFISQVPPEARLALQAVRRASVGVYELPHEALATQRAKMFRAADELMNRRGWSRVVAVKEDDTVVLVFTPTDSRGGATERVCLAVCDDDNLVVVAGTIEVGPLTELISKKAKLVKL